MSLKRTPFRRTKYGVVKMREPIPYNGPESNREIESVDHERGIVKIKPLHRGTYTGGTLAAAPKTIAHRNQRLLDLARGKPCLLCIEGVCCGDSATVVACHSGSSKHGKAGARKADDQYSVWGCATCHRWLDEGPGHGWIGELAFESAHARQVAEWSRMVGNMAVPPADRRAIHWALALLEKT